MDVPAGIPVFCGIHAALTAAGVLAVLSGRKAITIQLQAARLFAVALLEGPASFQHLSPLRSAKVAMNAYRKVDD